MMMTRTESPILRSTLLVICWLFSRALRLTPLLAPRTGRTLIRGAANRRMNGAVVICHELGQVGVEHFGLVRGSESVDEPLNGAVERLDHAHAAMIAGLGYPVIDLVRKGARWVEGARERVVVAAVEAAMLATNPDTVLFSRSLVRTRFLLRHVPNQLGQVPHLRDEQV